MFLWLLACIMVSLTYIISTHHTVLTWTWQRREWCCAWWPKTWIHVPWRKWWWWWCIFMIFTFGAIEVCRWFWLPATDWWWGCHAFLLLLKISSVVQTLRCVHLYSDTVSELLQECSRSWDKETLLSMYTLTAIDDSTSFSEIRLATLNIHLRTCTDIHTLTTITVVY